MHNYIYISRKLARLGAEWFDSRQVRFYLSAHTYGSHDFSHLPLWG
jgi:hypothetical protein